MLSPLIYKLHFNDGVQLQQSLSQISGANLQNHERFFIQRLKRLAPDTFGGMSRLAPRIRTFAFFGSCDTDVDMVCLTDKCLSRQVYATHLQYLLSLLCDRGSSERELGNARRSV